MDTFKIGRHSISREWTALAGLFIVGLSIGLVIAKLALSEPRVTATDYAILVAQIYEREGNTPLALRRFEAFGITKPDETVAAMAQGYSTATPENARDAQSLRALAAGLGKPVSETATDSTATASGTKPIYLLTLLVAVIALGFGALLVYSAFRKKNPRLPALRDLFSQAIGGSKPLTRSAAQPYPRDPSLPQRPNMGVRTPRPADPTPVGRSVGSSGAGMLGATSPTVTTRGSGYPAGGYSDGGNGGVRPTRSQTSSSLAANGHTTLPRGSVNAPPSELDEAMVGNFELDADTRPPARTESLPGVRRPLAAGAALTRPKTTRRQLRFRTSYRLGDDPYEEIRPINDRRTGTLIGYCGVKSLRAVGDTSTVLANDDEPRYWAFHAWIQDVRVKDAGSYQSIGLVTSSAEVALLDEIEELRASGEVDDVVPVEYGTYARLETKGLVANLTLDVFDCGSNGSAESYFTKLEAYFDVEILDVVTSASAEA